MVVEIGYEVGVADLEAFLLLVLYVPVIVIASAAYLQRQFVVVVALGVEVYLRVLAQHEAVEDAALRSLERGMVVVISFHLDVAAVLHPVFFLILAVNGTVRICPRFHFLVIRALYSFSLHILEQIESRRSLGVVVGHLVAEAVGKLMKGVMTLRDIGPFQIIGFPGVENARTVAVGSVIVVGIVSVSLAPVLDHLRICLDLVSHTESAALRDVVYRGLFEIDVCIFKQPRAVEVDRYFRGASAQP